MKYKIIIGFLVLVIVISLGFNAYYYSATVDEQTILNIRRGYITVAWASQMADISIYLQNATTNIDVAGIRGLLSTASKIGEATLNAKFPDGERDLNYQMLFLPLYVRDNFLPYSEGSPFIKRINSTAIEMIRNLAQRISDVAHLVSGVDIDYWHEKRDPIQQLKEKGVLDSIINGCEDIRNLSIQIHDFNPKFQ